MKGQQYPHHHDDQTGADHYPAQRHVAVDAIGACGFAGAFLANIFQAGFQRGEYCGQRAEQGDQSGGGDGSRAHGANVRAPNLVGGHQRNRNGGRINRDAIGELPVKADGGHDDQPGNNASGKQNAGDARADDVADTEIFRSNGDAKRSAGKPVRPRLRLRSPGLHGIHQKGIGAAQTQAPENASGERAAAFSGDEDVSARGAFGKAEIAVLFDDELAAQRNHEEDAEPAAQQRQRKNSPEGEFGAKAQEDQCGDGEHDSGGERFTCRAGGLHDVVFKNRGAPEGPQDADGQNRYRNGSGNGETCAQTHVNGDGAEQQTEQRAKDDGAKRELLDVFVVRHERPEFAWGCGGTPRTFAQRKPPECRAGY